MSLLTIFWSIYASAKPIDPELNICVNAPQFFIEILPDNLLLESPKNSSELSGKETFKYPLLIFNILLNIFFFILLNSFITFYSSKICL